MADLKSLAEQIVNLTLLQAQELKQILKDEYGIEPAAGGAVMMAGPAAGAAAPAEVVPGAEDRLRPELELVAMSATVDAPALAARWARGLGVRTDEVPVVATPSVLHLQRTTAFGHYDDGFVLALERRTSGPTRQLHSPPVLAGRQSSSTVGGDAREIVNSASSGEPTCWKVTPSRSCQPRGSISTVAIRAATSSASRSSPSSTRSA